MKGFELLALVVATTTTLLSRTSVEAFAPSVSFINNNNKRSSLNDFRLFLAEGVEIICMESQERMTKSISNVKLNLQTIRTGRASANMLDRVEVEYYGTLTPLNQLASISVPSAQQLNVDPFDKSIAGDVERAIVDADLGLTPNNDGKMIRINIPPLSEERRSQMMKQCKAIGEEGKVAVRNIRRDGVDQIKKLEKSKEIGKDESLDGQDELQKYTDKSIKDIDSVVSDKEKEVSKV